MQKIRETFLTCRTGRAVQPKDALGVLCSAQSPLHSREYFFFLLMNSHLSNCVSGSVFYHGEQDSGCPLWVSRSETLSGLSLSELNGYLKGMKA